MNSFPTKRIEVAIEEVYPNPWNPNMQSEEIFRKLVDSIKQFGFIDTILVREKDTIYEIIDGEHKLTAAKELGYTKILVDSLGEIDDSTARTLTLVMNNTRGQDDVLKRAAMLKQIKEGQLALLPFSGEQIENELKLLNFDFDNYVKADKLEEQDEDQIGVPLKKMEEVVLLLQNVRATTKSKELRVLIEQFMDLVKAFKILLK